MERHDEGRLGPKSGVPRLAASVDFKKYPLDTVQSFVLSRVDGRTTLGEICLLVPFPEAQTLGILAGLHATGLIDIPGVAGPAPGALTAMAQPPLRKSLTPVAAPVVVPTVAPMVAPKVVSIAATDEPDAVDLPPDMRRRVDEMLILVGKNDPHLLLGVRPDTDKKEIRRAYFRLSKEFHPDRYFGKQLGPYKRRLQQIFTALTNSFEQTTKVS